MTKSASPDIAAADADLTYTIQVTNVGPVEADAATLGDTIPDGTTFVSLSAPAGWTCTTPNVGDGGTINRTRASFAAFAVADFTLVAHVPADEPEGTVFENMSRVGADTPDPSDENNSALTSVIVTSCPTVSLRRDAVRGCSAR